MLQIIPPDGAHRNMIPDSRKMGFQATDSTDNQLDFHARSTRFVQSFNDILVAQAVHLCNDMAAPSRKCVFLLPSNQEKESVL